MTALYFIGDIIRSEKQHKRMYIEVPSDDHDKVEKIVGQKWLPSIRPSSTLDGSESTCRVPMIIMDEYIKKYWELSPETFDKLITRLIDSAADEIRKIKPHKKERQVRSKK